MNPKLVHLLHDNMFKRIPTKSSDHKSRRVLDDECDEITLARYKYISNLCSLDPQPFEISDAIEIIERCCMMSSYNDFSLLTDDFFKHELLGVYHQKSGEQILYVDVKQVEIRDEYEYLARGMTFNDLRIHPLTIREQSILCLYMMKTYNETKCYQLRRLKIQAYIDRLTFPKNDTSLWIYRFTEFYKSLINCSDANLGKIVHMMFHYKQDNIFSIPIVMRRDIEMELARVHKEKGQFDKSREIYAYYKEYDLEIDCLLQLGNKSEAFDMLLFRLKCLEGTTNHADKVRSSDYCIKIAQLIDDISYYDKAFSIIPSYEPLFHKGVHLFKKKDFDTSLNVLRQALNLVPEHESILFAYGCCLKEVSQFEEAADIFERLIEKNRKNVEYHKDFALCQLYLGELEKCLTSLKEVIWDPTCVELFFRLSLANQLKSELRWVFTKFSDLGDLQTKIDLVVKAGFLSEDEIMESIDLNPKSRTG